MPYRVPSPEMLAATCAGPPCDATAPARPIAVAAMTMAVMIRFAFTGTPPRFGHLALPEMLPRAGQTRSAPRPERGASSSLLPDQVTRPVTYTICSGRVMTGSMFHSRRYCRAEGSFSFHVLLYFPVNPSGASSSADGPTISSRGRWSV